MDQPLRVVQWATGNTGTVALSARTAASTVQLVGVRVHDPRLAGNDLGELMGSGIATGAPVCCDADAVIAPHPDCVCFLATDLGHIYEVITDFCRLLVAGFKVVTTAHPLLVHPEGAGSAVRRLLDMSCATGGSSFLCTGVEPGFMADALVLHLSSLSGGITGVRIQAAMNAGADSGGRWRPGRGSDVPTDVQHYIAVSIAQNWSFPMAMLADGLGVTLDRVYERREIASAGKAIHSARSCLQTRSSRPALRSHRGGRR